MDCSLGQQEKQWGKAVPVACGQAPVGEKQVGWALPTLQFVGGASCPDSCGARPVAGRGKMPLPRKSGTRWGAGKGVGSKKPSFEEKTRFRPGASVSARGVCVYKKLAAKRDVVEPKRLAANFFERMVAIRRSLLRIRNRVFKKKLGFGVWRYFTITILRVAEKSPAWRW